MMHKNVLSNFRSPNKHPMKKIFASLSILCFTFCIFNSSFGQAPAIQWAKCYGGTDNDYARFVQLTPDGGYIICGEEHSIDGDVTGNHGSVDYWIVKTDDLGILQWQKTFGGTFSDNCLTIALTRDGGYILGGATLSHDGDISENNSDTLQVSDYWVVKVDSGAVLQWEKTLGGSGNDWGKAAQQTYNGGYIIAGMTESNDSDVTGSHGFQEYWVAKLDSVGNLIWQKALGGSGRDDGYFVIQSADSGYVVAGAAFSNDGDVSGNHGGKDWWIVKLDIAGNIQWQKTLGGTSSEEPYSVIQTSDGGYMAAGFTFSNNGDVTGNHGNKDYWLVKLDGSGNLQWQKCYGGSAVDEAHSVEQTNDGGYIVAGYSGSNDGDVSGNHGGSDYWILKTDSAGVLQWQKSLGGGTTDIAQCVKQSTDGGYIVVGSTSSNDGDVIGNHDTTTIGHPDYWVVKLGNSETGIIENKNPIQNFNAHFYSPNNLSLYFFSLQSAKLLLTLFDITGRTLFQKPFTATEGINKQEVQVTDLAKGIYIASLSGENASVVSKFVKE
jgi:hypothetical protein